MKDPKTLTPKEIEDGYHVTAWGGRESFTCITCHYATFDAEDVADHHYNVHILRPQLQERARNAGGEIDVSEFQTPSVPLYDADNNLITDKRGRKNG